MGITLFDKTLSTGAYSSKIKISDFSIFFKMYRICEHISNIQLIEKNRIFYLQILVSHIHANRNAIVVTKCLSKSVVRLKSVIPLGIDQTKKSSR